MRERTALVALAEAEAEAEEEGEEGIEVDSTDEGNKL